MPLQLVKMQPALTLWRLMLGSGDQPAEVLPASCVADQQGERRIVFQRELRAEDGLDAEGLGGFLEADRAVDIVVVGQCQAGHAQTRRFGQHGVGRCDAAQQAVGGMGAEFNVVDVGHGCVSGRAIMSSASIQFPNRRGEAATRRFLFTRQLRTIHRVAPTPVFVMFNHKPAGSPRHRRAGRDRSPAPLPLPAA